MKRILLPIFLFVSTLSSGMNFRPPTATERLNAIGPIEGLPETLRRALTPAEDFEPIAMPKTGDWLAEHREAGQSFDDFVRSKPNRPDKYRGKISLQPLGEFPSLSIPLVESLKEYASAYFGMPIHELGPLNLNDRNITTRINAFTHNRQILTTDVLAILKANLPKDAFCVMAITMEDLYPDPSWNFVFGQASPRERVGAYSFARYDPAFYGQKRDKNYQKLLLWRSCKVLVHEIGHMFGLNHCIYFHCVLNGSNHLKESDARPMHLCPVCLHKLQHSIGFDVATRYGNLFRYYRKAGFDKEARWVKNRLEHILPDEAARTIVEQESAD